MLSRIKNLRGILYKKIKKREATVKVAKEAIDNIIPGFSVKQKPTSFIEFPKYEDVTKINIIYPLIEPFAYANIKWNPETKEVVYNIIEPELTEKEIHLLKKISEGLIELIEVELSAVKESEKAIEYLNKSCSKVISEYGLILTQNEFIKIMYFIYRNFIGFNEIEPLLEDPNIEDISCDGTKSSIYVIHRKFGSVKTNIAFNETDTLREFVIKLAERSGRYVSYAEPILAGTLPDGSRVSATLAGDVATRGPTFTIRKFGEKPFSPIEQIELGTASVDVLAYLWYLIEGGLSLLVIGGVATGKTSFLNSIAIFIPPESRIITIEDTRELKLMHEHWVAGLARVGFGIPLSTGEKYGEVTLFDLLKESFRQNPDYVVVGEVRGAEASVMFQGMSSGHPSLSTFHAGSVDTLIKRLTTPPIELSPTLIESLDVILIMVHAREKGKSARRIKEIVEVEGLDVKTNEIKTRQIFVWDPINDKYEKVGESLKVQELITAKGGRLEDAKAEIETRKKILEMFIAKGIKDFNEVNNYINTYYKEPEKITSMFGQKIEILKPLPTKILPTTQIKTLAQKIQITKKMEEKPKELEKRRTSILELLGYKIIREK